MESCWFSRILSLRGNFIGIFRQNTCMEPQALDRRSHDRLSIAADGQRLDIEFNVEYPRTFTTAWSAKVTYAKIPPRSGEGPQRPILAQIICPENNRDVAGGIYPIPMATTPDF